MSARQFAPFLPDLHLLGVLAETRSYTRAARLLGASKSSVSMRIKALERAAGVPLVQRTTRSVALTPAGVQLAERMRAPFAEIEQGFSAVRDLAGAPRGVVRLTAPVALGRQWIAPSLPALLRRYPQLRLELDLNDRLAHLVQDGYDLAVRHVGEPPPDCIATPLCEVPTWLLASPDYLRRRGTPREPADLAGHDCLLYLRDPAASATWWFEPAAGRAHAGRVAVRVAGPLRANNSEVLREALVEGLGIGLLPAFSVPPGAVRGGLVPVLPEWRPVGFFGERLFALRPWSARTPRSIECVLEHLRESLARAAAGVDQRPRRSSRR